MIVFADADLDLAAKEAVAFSLANCGQVCCAVERVYVASDVAEAFEKKCVELAKTHGRPRGSSADGSRRRRGRDVDIPWRPTAATPQPRRGIFRGDRRTF